jgi:hypothetical protein
MLTVSMTIISYCTYNKTINHDILLIDFTSINTWSDNKVRELAVCLLWQQWAETSVWFDDVGISAFHSCVVVDLFQSLSEWRLLLSECVLMCCHENVRASC